MSHVHQSSNCHIHPCPMYACMRVCMNESISVSVCLCPSICLQMYGFMNVQMVAGWLGGRTDERAGMGCAVGWDGMGCDAMGWDGNEMGWDGGREGRAGRRNEGRDGWRAGRRNGGRDGGEGWRHLICVCILCTYLMHIVCTVRLYSSFGGGLEWQPRRPSLSATCGRVAPGCSRGLRGQLQKASRCSDRGGPNPKGVSKFRNRISKLCLTNEKTEQSFEKVIYAQSKGLSIETLREVPPLSKGGPKASNGGASLSPPGLRWQQEVDKTHRQEGNNSEIKRTKRTPNSGATRANHGIILHLRATPIDIVPLCHLLPSSSMAGAPMHRTSCSSSKESGGNSKIWNRSSLHGESNHMTRRIEISFLDLQWRWQNRPLLLVVGFIENPPPEKRQGLLRDGKHPTSMCLTQRPRRDLDQLILRRIVLQGGHAIQAGWINLTVEGQRSSSQKRNYVIGSLFAALRL